MGDDEGSATSWQNLATGQELWATKIRWQIMGATLQVGENGHRPEMKRHKNYMGDDGVKATSWRKNGHRPGIERHAN